MPQMPWDRNRIQDLPDPEGSKGGSDDQLGVASDAVADAEAEQNPYVPPLPVPLARMIERQPGARGISEPAWLLNPPAALPGFGVVVGNAGQFADDSTDAAINAVRVDNLTRQWMYFPDVQVWVPPLWIGRVFRYNGSHNRRVRFETPAGMTALTLSTTEVAAVTFYEEMMPEVDGEQLSSSVISGILGAVAIAGDAGQAQTQAYSADATSQALLGLIVNSRLEAWNAGTSTVDRLRTAGATAGLTMGTTGILAAGLSFFSANLGAYTVASGFNHTDNQSANLNQAVNVNAIPYAVIGATLSRIRMPNVFKQMASVAIGAGSAVTVWTPAAGLKPRLMGWVVSPSSALLVPAAVTFFETSTTGTFMGETGFMSSGSGAAETVSYGQFGPIVSTSSAVIVAFSSTGLTLRGTLWGTEE